MTSLEQRLYDIYAAWTGQLHYYVVKELGRHIDCEYLPNKYEFRLYSGHAEDADLQVWNFRTVPGLHRPPGEARAIIKLPTPEDHPTQAELDNTFRELCLAAARVLEIDLSKPKLPAPKAPQKKHAFPKRRLKSNENPDLKRRRLETGNKED